MITALFLLACSGSADTSSTDDSSGDTDTDAGDDTAPACTAITPGDDWEWRGECPQMTTPVTVEVNGCDLVLSYPSGMTMDMPYSGTVSGDAATFADDDGVTGCTGTAETADKITGSCDGGCTYTLKR